MGIPLRKTGLEGIENWDNVKGKLSLEEISIIENNLQQKISCFTAINFQKDKRFRKKELEEKKKHNKKAKGNKKYAKENSVITRSELYPQACSFSYKPLGEYILSIYFQGGSNYPTMNVKCPGCGNRLGKINPLFNYSGRKRTFLKGDLANSNLPSKNYFIRETIKKPEEKK